MRKFLLCIIALLCAPIYAQQLSPFEARYDAFRNGSKLGHAVMRLDKLAGQQYKLFYKSDVSIFFLSDKREETSVFHVKEDGTFLPQTYVYKRTGTGSDKSLTLKFEQTTGKITINNKANINWNNEWDNQLYRFDFQKQLASGNKEIEYDLINYRGQKRHYAFEVLGEEMLDLPYGTINAIKVKTVRPNKRRETYAWFAPDLHYQMVRLQQFKNGDEQGDIKLASLTLVDSKLNQDNLQK